MQCYPFSPIWGRGAGNIEKYILLPSLPSAILIVLICLPIIGGRLVNVPVCFRRATSLYALGSVTLSEGEQTYDERTAGINTLFTEWIL